MVKTSAFHAEDMGSIPIGVIHLLFVMLMVLMANKNKITKKVGEAYGNNRV